MKSLLTVILILMISFACFGSGVSRGGRPIPREQWTDSTKVWLARSCVGEAGFDAYEECIGIAWVYAVRWKSSAGRDTLEGVIRSYSAAVKSRNSHKRKWIFDLRLDGKRPKGWPKRLSWKGHLKFWNKILFELEQWSKGFRPNPVKGAIHWGGSMDTPHASWVRVLPEAGVKFKNIFYRSKYSAGRD